MGDNQNMADQKKTFAQQIESIADGIDISTIQSVASEMDRRFKAAENAITELLVLAYRIDTDKRDWEYMRAALSLILPDDDGTRYFPLIWEGISIKVPVDGLDSIIKTRQAIADNFGVSTRDLLQFEMNENKCVGVPCNHPGCSMERQVGVSTPLEMKNAIHRVSLEIWYCHHHREEAFNTDRALSDCYLPLLERVFQQPGISKTDAVTKTSDTEASIGLDHLEFLERCHILKIDRLSHKGKTLRYRLYLGEDGLAEIKKLLKNSSDCA